MKASFRVKVKKNEYETAYEVVGKPPEAVGFSARGFTFEELDDVRLRRLIRRVITAPARPPRYLYEMAGAFAAQLVDTFEKFDLMSYSVDADLLVDDMFDASMSLSMSLYVVDDGECGDDDAPPCRLVAAAEASCDFSDDHHEVVRYTGVGDAERGIVNRAAIRHVAFAAIKHAYNACSV